MPTEEEALSLLSRVPYGRLALTREALPHVAVARHVVRDGQVILRTHRGWGVHRACDGTVVAYEADNATSAQPQLWAVQFMGTARIFTPSEAQRALFGSPPVSADGEPFEPVYLRIEPRYVTSYRVCRAPR